MTRFKNSRKAKKLDEISRNLGLSASDNDLTKRFKINLSYFNATQSAGYDFKDISNDKLINILENLKHNGNRSLEDLSRLAIGGGSIKGKRRCIFEKYGDFPPPSKTNFKEPKNIPEGVRWARIRITNYIRVVGFIVPAKLHGIEHSKTKFSFDKNTFYIVFIDLDHKFWNPKR